MQGKYRVLKSYIQNENPRAVNVWCFAHILNLVVVNVCESSIHSKQFFTTVQALTVFMSARKRNAKFTDNQIKLYPKSKMLRLKNLSTTRWCSHDRAINVIYHKYLAVIKTLESLLKSDDATTVIQARGLYHSVSSFEFIAVMIFMRKLFAVTTPLSNYLQSSSLGYVEALCLVDSVQNRIKILRAEEQFSLLIDESKSFASDNNLVVTGLKEIRTRRIKRMPGELCQDESNIDIQTKFKIEFFYYSLDIVNETLENRFRSSRGLLTDLSLLTEERILFTKNNNEYSLSKNEFSELAKWLPEKHLENLQTEYKVFAKVIKHWRMQLKIIKNRLRTTTQQDRLESLILLSSEKDIEIDLEKATDLLARSSDI
ncbi:hypothetical protein ACI65C_006562 [Semiaphis heraclei]